MRTFRRPIVQQAPTEDPPDRCSALSEDARDNITRGNNLSLFEF